MFSKKLSIIFFSLLVVISFGAQAQMHNVPGLNLTGLDQFSGQNVSVFYVSGRSPGVSAPGSELHTHKVFASQGPFRIHNGQVDIPAINVLSNQGGVVFNHVLFVVHSQPRVALQNRDGTCPAPTGVVASRSRTEYCRDNASAYNFIWQESRVSRSLRGNGTVQIRF